MRLQETREIEPAAAREEGRPQVAELRDACRHVLDPEIVDDRAVFELFPRERRRDCGERLRPRGVRRGERSTPGVLVVVDEYAAYGSLRDAVFGGDQRGAQLRHVLRELLREAPDLFLRRAANDADVDVDAFRAGGLRERLHAEAFERGAHEKRSLAHRLERRAWNRVEVEVQVIRTIDVVATRVPLIQVDASQVHEPEQRGEILHHWKVNDVA